MEEEAGRILLGGTDAKGVAWVVTDSRTGRIRRARVTAAMPCTADAGDAGDAVAAAAAAAAAAAVTAASAVARPARGLARVD